MGCQENEGKTKLCDRGKHSKGACAYRRASAILKTQSQVFITKEDGWSDVSKDASGCSDNRASAMGKTQDHSRKAAGSDQKGESMGSNSWIPRLAFRSRHACFPPSERPASTGSGRRSAWVYITYCQIKKFSQLVCCLSASSSSPLLESCQVLGWGSSPTAAIDSPEHLPLTPPTTMDPNNLVARAGRRNTEALRPP